MDTNLSLVLRRLKLCAFSTVLILSASVLSAAQTPDTSARIYLVAHVDLVPDAAAAGAKLLQQYVAETRKDKGAMRVELYLQLSRTNHFTLVEVWENQKAYDDHVAAAHTRQFREKIQPLLGSPFDERLHHIVE